jgi:hyperosmotically inducible periplasmic protein
MTSPRTLSILTVCAALLIGNAVAQTDQVSSAAPATSVSKKAMREANRKTVRSVRRSLERTQDLEVSNIVVKASDGAVLLEGTVPSESQISLAETAASSTPNVKSVDNRLKVRIPGGH